MKRTIPLLITAVAGLVLIFANFIPAAQSWGEAAAIWFDILASIAFVLGGGNLLKLQLQKISDRKPGWGYAAVTLVSFLVMLICGLFKVGSPPESNVEHFGEVFTPLAASDLPEYRVPGTIPQHVEKMRLPDSVHAQIEQDQDELVFRGWMISGRADAPDQQDDLIQYDDSLAWRSQVEDLFEASQLPEDSPLQGKVWYFPYDRMLAFAGRMSDEQRDAMRALNAGNAAWQAATEQLYALSRKVATQQVPSPPPGFSIPADEERVRYLDGTLEVQGPISNGLRNQLVNGWVNAPKAYPLTAAEQQNLLDRLQAAGPVSETQSVAFTNFFNAAWRPQELIVKLNLAGVVLGEKKSDTELYEEQQAVLKAAGNGNAAGNQNVLDPIKPAPDSVSLSPQQEQLIRDFVNTSPRDPEALVTSLAAAGPWIPPQAAALQEFLSGLPSQNEQYRELGLKLIEFGPLTPQQRELLFSGARQHYVWAKAIDELQRAAHQTKYPWSGGYSAVGNPFEWLFEFILQPLLKTTFAMLAFYVASAAYRAFRAKNLEATLLLVTAFIVLLGRTFAGQMLTADLPDWLSALKIDQLTLYIMKIFNTAGNRAIMIGIALGMVSTSLKVLLGIDRSYLGSGND